MLDAIINEDRLGSLTEDVKKEYRPGTEEEGLKGKYVLSVGGVDGWNLENIAPLKTGLGNLKAQRDELKSKLEGYGNVTPESLTKITSELENAKAQIASGTDASKVKSQVDAAVALVTEKFTTEATEREGIIKDKDSVIQSLVIDNATTAALAKHKGNPTFLTHHIKSNTKVELVDGKPTARIIDPKTGTVRISMKQGSVEPMDIDEFVEIMKTNEEFKPAFQGTGASGAGTTGSGGKPSNSGIDTSLTGESLLNEVYKT